MPLCLLTTEQQIKFKTQAEIRRYKTGEIIWSTSISGNQFLVVSGNVRLKEDGKPKSLDLLQKSLRKILFWGDKARNCREQQSD